MWPNLNEPHSGWPSASQPLGSRASFRTSAQPIGLSGHPSASAIGFQIAITTGESTRFFVSLTRSLPPAPARDSALPSSMNAPDAGLSRWALRVPASTSSTASPEPIGVGLTRTRLPLTTWPAALYARVTSVIHCSFSEPYANSSTMSSARTLASGAHEVRKLTPSASPSRRTIIPIDIGPDSRRFILSSWCDLLADPGSTPERATIEPHVTEIILGRGPIRQEIRPSGPESQRRSRNIHIRGAHARRDVRLPSIPSKGWGMAMADPPASRYNEHRPVANDFAEPRTMPSPFPGMDPYLEAPYIWPDFHDGSLRNSAVS